MSTNQLYSFAKDCVSLYAIHNQLNVLDLPDTVKNRFTSIIMEEDSARASESTGPDNPDWNNKMLPALTKYLKNPSNKDETVEFNNIWKECTTKYMQPYMQELIDKALYEFDMFQRGDE